MNKAYLQDKSRRMLIWEAVGVLWIVIVGSLLHFLYGWSNYSRIVGALAPVNESVWEHLKLGYWSLLLYSIIEYRFFFSKVGQDINDFFTAKFLGLISLEFTVLLIYYSYTAFLNRSILWLDISSYILGAFFCQLVSYQVLLRKNPRLSSNLGLALFVLVGLIMIVFTYYPPHLPIFRDSITGSFGL